MFRIKQQREIGGLCNERGCLEVLSEGGEFFWSIENGEFDGHHWRRIPEALYRALMDFEDNRHVFEGNPDGGLSGGWAVGRIFPKS